MHDCGNRQVDAWEMPIFKSGTSLSRMSIRTDLQPEMIRHSVTSSHSRNWFCVKRCLKLKPETSDVTSTSGSMLQRTVADASPVETGIDPVMMGSLEPLLRAFSRPLRLAS